MDNIKEFNTAGDNSRGYKIIIGVLAVILLIMGFLYFNQQKKTELVIVELEDITGEKAALTKDYEELLLNYNEIETTNDSISTQLVQEKARITELIAELKSTKSQNRAEINKYKNELKTLRDIMKGFVHQIDSLNTLNIELTAENVEIKKQVQTAKKENKQLAQKYDEAADKVKIASVIKAVDVTMSSLNEKGKPTTRAKKTKRFAVSFSLDENAIAPQGTKNIYLRITDPNQHILIQNNQPVFSYEGEEIAYSSVRQVEYNGELVNAIVYFEYNEQTALVTGTYNVDIFCDGSMIGAAVVKLN